MKSIRATYVLGLMAVILFVLVINSINDQVQAQETQTTTEEVKVDPQSVIRATGTLNTIIVRNKPTANPVEVYVNTINKCLYVTFIYTGYNMVTLHDNQCPNCIEENESTPLNTTSTFSLDPDEEY